MTVRVYYLEEALAGNDLQFISEEFANEEEIEQIRIPYVLPANREGLSLSVLKRHEGLLRKRLRALGVARDKNQQVVLVAPKDMYWYSVLLGAIAAETGIYPHLVQTEGQRQAIGNPGATRILDTQGLMGLKPK